MPITFTPETSAFNVVGDHAACGTRTPHHVTTSSYFSSTYYTTTSVGFLGGAAYSPTLGLWVIGGQSCDLATAIISSPGGGVWTGRGNPWGAGGGCHDVVWAAALGLFVAVGEDGSGNAFSVTSPDGVTWTAHLAIGGETLLSRVFWSQTLGQLLAIGASGYWKSTNGISWSAVSIPATTSVECFAYQPGTGWVGVGFANPAPSHPCIVTSPDGVTWTGRASDFQTGGLTEVIYSATLGGFVAVGSNFASPAHRVAFSNDGGATWGDFNAPWNNYPAGLAETPAGITVAAFSGGSPTHSVYTSEDLINWTIAASPLDSASAEMFAPSLAYDPGTNRLILTGVQATRPNPVIFTASPTAPPPPAPPHRKWTNGTMGRIIVTDLAGRVTTWLDKVHLGATIDLNLNQPAQITVQLRPNTLTVNDLYTDGDPLVAQSNRLIYILLREGGNQPWVCRAAGIIMSPEDQADADVPTTHLVAYDPWQYLSARPFYINTSGDLAGPPDGFLFPGTRGDVIIGTALKNTIESEGVGVMIDGGPSYGGTVYWGGHYDATPILDYQVQPGQTLADVWNGVIAAGDPSGGSGGADIILTPIYDPVRRPGFTHELSVYNLAGSVVPASPMAWGEYTRVATTADRQHDGTPGAFINEAYYYAGQAGFPVGLVQNGISVAKYQPYRATQFFPNQPQGEVVQAFAQQALSLQKQGKRTFTVDPDPMRAPAPFTGYNLGDRIPLLAPNDLRVAATGYQRIQTIPLEINQDGVTRVRTLLVTADWRGDDST